MVFCIATTMRNTNTSNNNNSPEDQRKKESTLTSLDSRFNQTLRNVQGYAQVFSFLIFSLLFGSIFLHITKPHLLKTFIMKVFEDLSILTCKWVFWIGFGKPIWILVLIYELWLLISQILWYDWENSCGSCWFWCIW